MNRFIAPVRPTGPVSARPIRQEAAMFTETKLQLLDAANNTLTVGTTLAHLGLGAQGMALAVRHVTSGAEHVYQAQLAQLEMGVGLTLPVTLTSAPGEVQILGYTLPLGRIVAGLRGDADPAADALGGRIVAITGKVAAGYGHELTALFFLGGFFDSVGDCLLDGVSTLGALVPAFGPVAMLLGQARHVAVFAGGIVEPSLSASGAIAAGWLR
jgi:hypothetical protein